MSLKISKKPKIVVILGPTSSGKTGLAVKLAAKFNGEIVSADSRQVYRGMDVGTGKDLKEYELRSTNYEVRSKSKIGNLKSKITRVPYHLIDVVSPKQNFDLAKYKKRAEKAIEGILKRKKLPILVGGSGLYLQAVVDDYRLSGVKADQTLRRELEKSTAGELFKKLEKINLKLAARINQSDRGNKRRLIRYLEILSNGGKPLGESGKDKKYDALLIGLDWPTAMLNQRIEYRLLERLEKEAMVAEVKRLHDEGVNWKRLESFGLEYKFISQHLQGNLSYNEMREKLYIAIRQFARRQRSWFRRWERQGRVIHWLREEKVTEKLIKDFI